MSDSPAEVKSKSDTYPINYVVGLIVGALLFAGALIAAQAHQPDGFQTRIFYDLNNLPDGLTGPALWITEGLGALYPIMLCVLVPIFFNRYRLAWRFFVTVASAEVLMEAAKLIVKEPRPLVLLNGQVHQRAVELGLTGFPSGHTAVATALALTLWLILPRAWRWLSLLWIVLVGLSRIYLGVHLPADVIGGFAIGLLTVCSVRLLPRRIAKPLHLGDESSLLDRGR